MTKRLALQHVSHRYAPNMPYSVEDISFNVHAGECIALLGPSGCGKSTLLKIIAGLEQAETGALYWEAHNLNDTPAEKRGFAMVFQDYALFTHLNVLANVGFGLRMKNSALARGQRLSQADIDAIAMQYLEKLQIGTLADRSTAQLSGGQQQRVAVARALASQPRLLLLDEPFSSLNNELRIELQQVLKTLLMESQIPSILVTHDTAEASYLAHQTLHMKNGQLV